MYARTQVFVVFCGTTFLFLSGTVYAQKTGISVESTNTYNTCSITPDLSNSNSSATNFANAITTGTSFVISTPCSGSPCQDGNAWNVDFLDPGTSGAPSGADDNSTTDASNIAISYFQGHGIGTIQDFSARFCTSQTQCTSPPSGATNGWGGGVITTAGACVFTPVTENLSGLTAGVCNWPSFRSLVTCGTGDQGSGSGATQNHLATYTGPNVVLGNNSTAGNWRGAGTNGGASMAIFHVSHAMEGWFPNLEWASLYGGLQIFASLMIAPDGDTSDSPGFGGAVGGALAANVSLSAASAYVNAMSSIMDGGGCAIGGSPNSGSSFGGGLNGCGCHVALSYSDSASDAVTLLNTTVTGLQSDSSLANSTAIYAYAYGCNYNFTTFPISGGN